MENYRIKNIVIDALFIALVFLTTFFTKIPTGIPGGYFNLGDAVIMTSAIMFGRKRGMLIGAIGSAIADLAYGAFIFIPVTFIVKGIEGYVCGVIYKNGKGQANRIIAIISAAVVIVAGYFFFEAFILGLIDKEFGFAVAVIELIPNTIQALASAVCAYFLSIILQKLYKNINV